MVDKDWRDEKPEKEEGKYEVDVKDLWKKDCENKPEAKKDEKEDYEYRLKTPSAYIVWSRSKILLSLVKNDQHQHYSEDM